MLTEIDEITRIQRRIGKAQRRITRGYRPKNGKETEEQRLSRLTKRLDELKNKKTDDE